MLKKMRPRLHSVLTLLLACLMLGASMQSAICEMTCSRGGTVSCHRGVASSDEAMAGMPEMPEMHCDHMKGMQAADAQSNCVHVDELGQGMCHHPSAVLAADSSSRSEKTQAVHWIVVEPVVVQTATASYSFAANSKAPPFLPPVNLLNVTLRI